MQPPSWRTTFLQWVGATTIGFLSITLVLRIVFGREIAGDQMLASQSSLLLGGFLATIAKYQPISFVQRILLYVAVALGLILFAQYTISQI